MGLVFFLEIWKIQKHDWPRIPRFHATSNIFRTYRHFCRNMFWFNWIYLFFDISRNMIIQKYQDSTPSNLWKRLDIPIVLDPPDSQKKLKQMLHVWCSVGSETLIFEFWNVEIWGNNIFSKWFHNCSCISWSNLVLKNKCKRPDLVNILEIPEIIQKVLEYVRGP